MLKYVSCLDLIGRGLDQAWFWKCSPVTHLWYETRKCYVCFAISACTFWPSFYGMTEIYVLVPVSSRSIDHWSEPWSRLVGCSPLLHFEVGSSIFDDSGFSDEREDVPHACGCVCTRLTYLHVLIVVLSKAPRLWYSFTDWSPQRALKCSPNILCWYPLTYWYFSVSAFPYCHTMVLDYHLVDIEVCT